MLRPEPFSWWSERYWEGTTGAPTVKLHGDLGSPEADDVVVLTRRDYRRRLYADVGYTGFLRSVMATNTVLYLGFSFQDAYLNELRSEVLSLLGHGTHSTPVAYAVVNDVAATTEADFLHHEGIQLLSYDSTGEPGHAGFDRYLDTIHSATNPLLQFGQRLERRRVLWVDPPPVK